jgi:hypothetical protein
LVVWALVEYNPIKQNKIAVSLFFIFRRFIKTIGAVQFFEGENYCFFSISFSLKATFEQLEFSVSTCWKNTCVNLYNSSETMIS